MAEVRNASVFPVVLYFRERRLFYYGNVEIRPAYDFEQFRTVLNGMLGGSGSFFHLSGCIVDNRRPDIPLERRKIVVAGKFSFSVLDGEKSFNFIIEIPLAPQLAPGDMFLSQLHIINPRMTTYEGLFHDLQTQNSNNVNRPWNCNCRSSPPVNVNSPRRREAVQDQGSGRRELCEDCRIAETQGTVAPFHHCVYDEIIYGFFRSPAGPIGRFKLHR